MTLKIDSNRFFNLTKQVGDFFDEKVFSHFGIGDFDYSDEIFKFDPIAVKYFTPFYFPAPTSKYSYRPARYFAKGLWETDKKRYPPPIPFLLVESTEEDIEHNCPKVNKKMKEFPLKGVLKKTPFGLVYLDIDDKLALDLLPLIPEEVQKPPYFSLFNPPRGAHSPVIAPQEMQRRNIDPKPLLGKKIRYKIKGLYSVKPNSWKEVDKAYILTIESPDLEMIREGHRLSPRLGGNDFHVVVATVPAKKKNKPPSMRINLAYQWI